ncbi:hypothetical protein EZJ49_02920 [Bdellovibrio bacteriovorus]|uniref:hypothetical protein n=1 Tax=Bdellovibrio bacteriovorus TaxID=959 RepID=UPI0021D2B8F3|nr:hypothetical protein [Bdellovibrio bacteriovorus]UXR65200.1 hypothetical protein EZJ49_02920 [Bdellovibrio bacteriovorus]
MKLLERLPKSLRPWVFALAGLFVYGGTVNLGFSDIFLALPFVLFVIYAALKWGRKYLLCAVLLLVVLAPLYYLKKQHSAIFFPATGKHFTVSEDVCLILHRSNYSGDFVVVTSITADRPCGHDPGSEAVRWVTLKARTPLQVREVSVSHADMGESYVIHTDSELGDVAFYGNQFIVWPDGRKIEQHELRRAIFYTPSLLMYWPTGPIMLMTLFKQ